MYCGDETGSFIGDIGSHIARFGYGGADCPSYVVPSYVAELQKENDQIQRVNPTSCYSNRWADCEKVSNPLRMAYSDADDRNAALQPLTDPNHFLQQGDCIDDWNAYEHLWQTAFDAMQVRQTLKHTTGGAPVKSAAAGGPSSNTIRASHMANEGRCTHPVLAVAPGCTHRVYDVNVNNNSNANNNRKLQQQQLIQMTEMFMETMDARALFVAPTPMLAAFTAGRQTALVVDVGAAGCRVTPVVDGLLLKQSQRRSGRGGDWLSHISWRALQDDQTVVTLRPRYQLGGFDKTVIRHEAAKSAIFHRWAMQDLLYELRTSGNVHLSARPDDTVSPPFWKSKDAADSSPSSESAAKRRKLSSSSTENDDKEADEEEKESKKGDEDDDKEEDEQQEDEKELSSPNSKALSSPAGVTSFYELPDGTLVDLTTETGKDLCRVPDLLFTDAQQLPFGYGGSSSTTTSILNQHATLSNLPLHELIRDSLSAVGDVDVRKELCHSILLSGGSSQISHLEQRLAAELSRIVPSAFKCKVIASKYAVERQYASWIGGSILSSLGSFQQLWLSRTEYEEYGAALAIQRFP